MGCIYIATCLPSNKKYIGKTKHTLKKRIIQHISASKKSNCIFHKALRKYGKINFSWGVLFESSDVSILYQKEKEFILQLGTYIPNGYNMTSGGEGLQDPTFSDEWHEKNKKRAENMAKAIFCLETETIYPSISVAAKITGTPEKTISGACYRKNRKTLRLHFCFAKEKDIEELKYLAKNNMLRLTKSESARKNMGLARIGKKRDKAFCEKRRQITLKNPPFKGRKHTAESLKKMSDSRKGKCLGKENGSARAVINIDTGEYFETMKEAVQKYKLSKMAHTNIVSCCRGSLKTAYGYRWKYADSRDIADIPQGDKDASKLDARQH